MNNLINMRGIKYTENMVADIFDKNPKLLEMVQETIYDNDMDYVQDEYLSKIDGVDWLINSCYEPWHNIWGNTECIAKQIIESDWDIDNIYDGENQVDCGDYVKRIEKTLYRLNYKVDFLSRSYDLLESKLEGMIECFLNTMESIVDGIVNSCYNDEDYVIQQFTEYPECFKLDNYYLNEDTLDVYKIEHA